MTFLPSIKAKQRVKGIELEIAEVQSNPPSRSQPHPPPYIVPNLINDNSRMDFSPTIIFIQIHFHEQIRSTISILFFFCCCFSVLKFSFLLTVNSWWWNESANKVILMVFGRLNSHSRATTFQKIYFACYAIFTTLRRVFHEIVSFGDLEVKAGNSRWRFEAFHKQLEIRSFMFIWVIVMNRFHEYSRTS